MEVVGTVRTAHQAYITTSEGATLNITCRSDLDSLTLEYDSVVYRQTQNNSGNYTINFSKTADKDDEYKLVICKATNATGQRIEDSAYVRVTGKSTSRKKIVTYCGFINIQVHQFSWIK